MSEINVIDLATKLIPIAVIIAKEILERIAPEAKDPEIEAAIALFNAVVAFLDVIK
jgi:hypothetical protein